MVNFARQLKVPGIYTLGFNDETCSPTAMFTAYNAIGASKELFIVPETRHWTLPEQREKLNEWIIDRLGMG